MVVPGWEPVQHAVDIFKILSITFLTLILITLTLRVYTRLRIVRCFEIEDWIIILASVLTTAELISVLISINGFYETINGRYDMELLLHLGRTTIAETVIWVCADTATRLSFGFFFLSLFKGRQNRKYRIYIWIVSVPVFVLGIITIPLVIIPTRGEPVTSVNSKMYAYTPMYVVQIIYAVFVVWSDFSITALSIYILSRVRLSTFAKIPAYILLAIQCCAGAASLVRLSISIKIRHRTQVDLVQDVAISYWSVIEVGLGIVTANMALTRPLFMYLFRKFVYKSPEFEVVLRDDGKVKEMDDLKSATYGSETGRAGRGEITKTQMISVVEDRRDASEYGGGLAQNGLVGDGFILEVSRS